jgi:hypothetical protein
MTTATLRRGTTERVMSRLFPKANPYVEDPNGWAKERGVHLWSGQQEINTSVVENRYTAVRSCHGIGKSYDAALLVNWWLDVHKPGEAFVVTTAPTGRQVYSILWRYIRRQHTAWGLPGRITLDAQFYLDIGGEDELVGIGAKPADYDPERFQGYHARYILVLLDEAGGVPVPLWNAVDSLMTSPGSRALAIGNPDDPNSHFKKVCEPASPWHRIKISAYDSPAFTGEPVPEALKEELVTKEWVQERIADWGADSPLVRSKIDAEFPDVSEDSLISMTDIIAAVNRELDGLDHGTFGVDVARYGDAESVIYRNRGGVVRRVWRGSKQSTMRTAGEVKAQLDQAVRSVKAVIDADGVGGGVLDRLQEQGMNVIPFHGGGRPSGPGPGGVKFKNLRAEMYWSLRKAFEDGEIDLDPEDELLQAQLSNIKFSVDSSGVIKVETKDEMRKRGLKSPDRADAVMMSRYSGSGIVQFAEAARKIRQESRLPYDAKEHDLTSDLLERPM